MRRNVLKAAKTFNIAEGKGATKMPIAVSQIPASKGQVLPPANLATLNDILTAWQAGKISYRQALELTGIDNLFDLYQAAISSDVKIRTALIPREQRIADAVTAAIKAARKNQTSASSKK
jgi:hypothetical protein